MADKQSTQTTKSTSAPWAEQAPYLKRGLERAESLYNSPSPQYFPQSTVAGFSPVQKQAQQFGIQRATQGNAGMDLAEGYNSDVLQGKYLNSDPYQDDVFRNIESRVLPSVNSQFMGSGRTGSNLHADTLMSGLTREYAPYATQMRQYGLGQMDAAANRAPTYAANDYMDITALDAIGGQQQDLAQRELDDASARWSFNQDMPYNRLAQYAGLIGGNYGGQTTSQVPYTKPGLLSTFGGLGLGAAGLLL